MGSKKTVLGIWTTKDTVAQIDRRRGPLSRSAYLNIILKEALEENGSIEVMHLSKGHREKLSIDQNGKAREP